MDRTINSGHLVMLVDLFRGIISANPGPILEQESTTEVILVWWTGTVLPIRFYFPPTCTVSGNRWLVGQVFIDISTMPSIMAEIIIKL